MDGKLFDKLNEQDRSSFFTDVKVSVLLDTDEDYTWTKKINVEYDIIVDYRSWGINGYELDFKNKPTVTIDFDDDRVEDVVVDLESAEVEWKPGGIIAPSWRPPGGRKAADAPYPDRHHTVTRPNTTQR